MAQNYDMMETSSQKHGKQSTGKGAYFDKSRSQIYKAK